MSLRRLQLVELEDLAWFPQTIRDLVTDYLQFMEARFGLHKPAVPVVRAMLETSKTACVVDLCSGGGGPILGLYEALRQDHPRIQITLTDKYPNIAAFEQLSSRHSSGIRYLTDPVDATDVPKDLGGMRTMFNAFHHFPPERARMVLENAVRAEQPIALFEGVERSWPTLISFLFVPLVVLFATPFVRPFQWKRLMWTYVFPLVPLACGWDGVISTWRAYTVAEMLAMTKSFVGYDWKADQVKIQGTTAHLTYLAGTPRLSNSAALDTA